MKKTSATSPWHFPLAFLEPIELYYYKVPFENSSSGSISKTKLEFGDNYLDDENIVLSQVGFCYSLTPKPLENYHHKEKEARAVKIVFPNDQTLNNATQFTYEAISFAFALHVFFTHEDNALTIGMGLHWQEREAFEARLIRQFEDVRASIELRTKKTKYIKKKTSCTDERINLQSLGPVLGPDLALAVEKSCLCYPKEFPLELTNPTIPFCQDYLDRICFRDLWRNFVKENSKFKPCTIFEYEGKFSMRFLSTFQDERILQKENVMDKKTNYMISYNFQQPEMLLLVEEYYVVPTLDLIGLIGGTLGMFVGFSFYGTFADALSLTLSILKKMTNAGKNFFLSLIILVILKMLILVFMHSMKN